MGDGVNDDETFENVVEDSLNASTVSAGPRRFELLNFAVSQYEALAHLTLLENGRVFSYSPDVVLVIAHRTDLFIKDRLARAAKLGRPIPDPFLLEIVQKAGIDPSMTTGETRRRLAPFDEALIDWTYRRIVATCRARGVVPVWVYIPTPEDKITKEEYALLQRKAVEAGFTIIDLSDVFRGQDEHSLILADWDKHPNAQGHRLIAQRLLKELRARPDLITGQGAPVPSGHM
jgi:ribosomal protein L39E